MRAGETKILRKLEAIASQVELLAEDFEAMSDDELRHQTAQVKERYAQGETLDDLAAEAFAAVREAAYRTLGQRPFHVQRSGRAAMHL